MNAPDRTDASVRLADVVGESALLLGAGSTVLHQLARTGVGLGVVEHSSTLSRPFDRLRTTLTYVYVMVLGSEEERRTIARLVNRAHAPVRSAGRYSAYDPDLQLWVAATLAQGAPFIYEKVWGSLDPASSEQMYRDAQVFGNALQVLPEQWPATTADFATYWDRVLDALEPDPAVQRYCRALLDARAQPAVLRWLAPLQDLLARGNLDPRARAALDLPWSARDQRRYDLFWRIFPPLYRLVPHRLRQLPATVVLWDVRRRLRTGAHVI